MPRPPDQTPRSRSRAAGLTALTSWIGAALLVLTGTACQQLWSTGPTRSPSAPLAPSAVGHDYTVTHAVMFGGTPSGYVIEFMAVPTGIIDQRDFVPGTWLVEDSEFQLVGFISAHDRAWRFDRDGRALDQGRGDRDGAVAHLLGRTGKPEYRETNLGVPRG